MNAAPDGVARLIAAYVRGDVDDARMTSWLRDVCERGLSDDDTYALTIAMARSGDVVDWRGLAGPIVDKHSTGGVGDGVSLVAVPLAASLGVRVAKLSGRALGHTGGTIDKLECVPGLRTTLSLDELCAQVGRIGCAIAAASDQLAPADKRLYALRHRTGTIASIPLIAASIMSKKIAGGASAVALEVTAGPGAFMQTADDARALARSMSAIGERAGMRVAAEIVRMDEPLGDAVGDALELDEALRVLEGGGGSAQLRTVSIATASLLIGLAGIDGDPDDALADGRAKRKFEELAGAQGGHVLQFDRSWPEGVEQTAARGGFLQAIDSRAIGETVARAKATGGAGASRFGMRLRRRIGDAIVTGDVLATWWLPRDVNAPESAFGIGDAPRHRDPLLAGVQPASSDR